MSVAKECRELCVKWFSSSESQSRKRSQGVEPVVKMDVVYVCMRPRHVVKKSVAVRNVRSVVSCEGDRAPRSSIRFCTPKKSASGRCGLCEGYRDSKAHLFSLGCVSHVIVTCALRIGVVYVQVYVVYVVEGEVEESGQGHS